MRASPQALDWPRRGLSGKVRGPSRAREGYRPRGRRATRIQKFHRPWQDRPTSRIAETIEPRPARAERQAESEPYRLDNPTDGPVLLGTVESTVATPAPKPRYRFGASTLR